MSEEVVDLLQRPTYMEILLCIISGRNYATSIARALKKKQPTVTGQLKRLEKAGLVKPAKREKSLKYEINWPILFEEFYNIIEEVIEERKNFVRDFKRIRKLGLRKIVPSLLFKDFLKDYSSTLLELGGKKKGFGEIVFSFFAALNNLEEEYWRKLIKRFKIDEKAFSSIVNLMATEFTIIEQTTLEVYIDTLKEGEKGGESLSKR